MEAVNDRYITRGILLSTSSYLSSLRYPIPTQEAGNALLTPLDLLRAAPPARPLAGYARRSSDLRGAYFTAVVTAYKSRLTCCGRTNELNAPFYACIMTRGRSCARAPAPPPARPPTLAPTPLPHSRRRSHGN
ncbi:hypothetical protein EVAR_16401_1 [Eumeta japonica]|uniref:Uncharacterized protein n=1 Tax=Eumeta variegata TaxID=151549 RepID=A0A4C1VWU1_EUMVA|nr:hypothetical protein EVAR_16401_1 [Eumeta japonica]